MFEDYVYNVVPILYMMISNSFVASCVYFLLWVIAWWSVLLAIVKRAVWLKFPVKTIVGILILLVLDAYFMFLKGNVLIASFLFGWANMKPRNSGAETKDKE